MPGLSESLATSLGWQEPTLGLVCSCCAGRIVSTACLQTFEALALQFIKTFFAEHMQQPEEICPAYRSK